MKGVGSLGDLLMEDRHEKLSQIPKGGYLLDEGNHNKSVIAQTSDPHYFPVLSVLLDVSIFHIKYATTGHETDLYRYQMSHRVSPCLTHQLSKLGYTH